MTQQPKIDPKKLLHKDSALRELLATHDIVYVHVDTRKPGVGVPDKLRGQPQIAFQFSYNPKLVPMRDILIDTLGVRATFVISRLSCECFFPWGAVYLIVGDSGYGKNWPIDTPPEVPVQRVGDLTNTAQVKKSDAPETKKRTLPPWCRGVIDGGKM